MTRRFFALAAALPLLLAGCGGDDDPQPKMPETQAASATPTPSASPTGPVEPTPPPETEGAGVKAAIAFVEHYYAMVTYAQATGDTAGLGELAIDSCASCRGGLDGIRRTYDRGGHLEGGALTVSKATGKALSSNTDKSSVFLVDATIEHALEEEYLPNRGKPEVYPAGSTPIRLSVASDVNGWHIADWYVSR